MAHLIINAAEYFVEQRLAQNRRRPVIMQCKNPVQHSQCDLLATFPIWSAIDWIIVDPISNQSKSRFGLVRRKMKVVANEIIQKSESRFFPDIFDITRLRGKVIQIRPMRKRRIARTNIVGGDPKRQRCTRKGIAAPEVQQGEGRPAEVELRRDKPIHIGMIGAASKSVDLYRMTERRGARGRRAVAAAGVRAG